VLRGQVIESEPLVISLRSFRFKNLALFLKNLVKTESVKLSSETVCRLTYVSTHSPLGDKMGGGEREIEGELCLKLIGISKVVI
jgi:hypothetical protein